MTTRAARLVLAASLLCACGKDPAPAPSSATPPAPAAALAPAPPVAPSIPVTYTALGADLTGFGPLNHTGIPGDKQWIAEAMGGAAILLDFDLDGDMDILSVDGNVCAAPPHPDARTRLFRNDGDLKFTDVTRESGIDVTGVGYGGAAADYDGDGDPDAFVGLLGRNVLLRNEGGGRFVDAAAEAGVQGPEGDMSTAACWADFDGDGWLDLYVSNYVDMRRVIEDFRKEGRAGRSCDWRGFRVYCGPMQLPYQDDRLYLSNGKDAATGRVTFRDATGAIGEDAPGGVPCSSPQRPESASGRRRSRRRCPRSAPRSSRRRRSSPMRGSPWSSSSRGTTRSGPTRPSTASTSGWMRGRSTRPSSSRRPTRSANVPRRGGTGGCCRRTAAPASSSAPGRRGSSTNSR